MYARNCKHTLMHDRIIYEILLRCGTSIEKIKNTITPVMATLVLLDLLALYPPDPENDDRVITRLLITLFLVMAFGDNVTKVNHWVSLQILHALGDGNRTLVRQLLGHPCLRIDGKLSLNPHALMPSIIVFEAKETLWKYLANKKISAAALTLPEFRDEGPAPKIYCEGEGATMMEYHSVTLLQYLLYILAKGGDSIGSLQLAPAHHQYQYSGMDDIDDDRSNDVSKISTLLHTIATPAKVDMTLAYENLKHEQEADICRLLSKAPAIYKKRLASETTEKHTYFYVAITSISKGDQTAPAEATTFITKGRLHEMTCCNLESELRLLVAIGAELESYLKVRSHADVYTLGTGTGTPLLQALLSGHANMASFLLEQGADPCVQLGDGSLRTALHVACECPFSYLWFGRRVACQGSARVD